MLRRVRDQILLALHRYPNTYLWLRTRYRAAVFWLQWNIGAVRHKLAQMQAQAPHPSLQERKRAQEQRLATQLTSFLEDAAARIQFPTTPEAPLVSIILVTYNRAEFTLECLRRLVPEALSIPLELIVVDNCSTDQTQALFSKVSGITFLPQQENLHFLRGSNVGASHAKGKYLLFLNSDAFITPAAIRSSVDIFSSETNVGAIGGKLLLPDGQIQEAGCMIYPDGTARGLLRHEAPSHPAAQVLRTVDFCSGAFLMTSSELFRSLQGFDDQYAPAYYEDADYCVRLRKQGFCTIYNPRAIIEHFEYGSATAKNSSILLMQERQKIFASQHPNYQSVLPKKVLIIDERLPYSRYGAGYPRTQAIIRALQELGLPTSIFPLFHLDNDDTATASSRGFC